MNTIVLLALILASLMAIIGGKKGLRSFLALFFNFSVIIILLFFLNVPTLHAIGLTILACLAIGCINLFYINGLNTTTKAAFLSTVVTTLFLLLLIVFISDKALIHGFGEEEMEEMGAFSLYIGINFAHLAISVILMSTIGAITDAAIAISSPMREMYYHHPNSTRKELFQFGLSIGQDIIGTSINTLFFAFLGSYLALLIWFKDLNYTFGEMMNTKVFSAEVITICCAAIGVTLVIPMTAFITAYLFVKEKKPMNPI